ncbi:MAG: 16S rRNA (guanine(527)-N(7))-methyltransferase RsmG [Firmicutes bacterium]|nr:16S rRNA (guanine(527)-N(7))-methyltransferase RsmG [Bacillota bacterium]
MELREFLSHEDFRFSEEKLTKLFLLADTVLEWNEHINVTAIKDRQEFIQKNIIDSLCLGHLDQFQQARTVLDIGTGGGFPGLPLAVVFPEKKFYLNDTIGKKLKVVSDTAQKLGLSNVEVVHARAEDLARDKNFRESFDVVTSRAVANMSTLSEYCIPFVKKGGYFLAFKTNDSMEEIEAAAHAFQLLKAEKQAVVSDGIEGSGHNFVIIRKTGETPAKYPRKAGTPSKEPL